MSQVIYRLPPFQLGPQVFSAHELGDTVDWGQADLKLPDFWDSGAAGIKIGIGDTGCPRHKDLTPTLAGARDFSGSRDVYDHNGHGTHVGGIVAAAADGRGVRGPASQSEVYYAKLLGDDGMGDNRGIGQGILWLAAQGCRIISLSLGSPEYDKYLAQVIAEVASAGVLVIAACGNSGAGVKVDQPAALPQALAVGSYNKSGKLSVYSSRGPEVDIVFPGEEILSCWTNNAYRRISGTSMATPLASGVTALLLKAQDDAIAAGKTLLQPVLGYQDLLARWARCCIDLGQAGRDHEYGYGKLDLAKFLAVETAGDPVEPIPSPTDLLPGTIELGFVRAAPLTHQGHQGLFLY